MNDWRRKSRDIIVFSLSAISIFCIPFISLRQETATGANHEATSHTEYVDYDSLLHDAEPYTRRPKNNQSRYFNRKDPDEYYDELDIEIDNEYNRLNIIRPEGTTYIDDEGNRVVADPNDILVLVNNERNLPADYEPDDLIIPDVPFPFKEHKPQMYMRREAAEALEELFAEAELAGIELYALSGYRPYKIQKCIFEMEVRQKGEELANTTVAYPGQSEHQTGLAMDITRKSAPYLLDYSFGQTPEGIWLYKNCHKYGFIVRYPEGKEDITGYSYEPWHIRYVGRDVAHYLYENNLALEEFFTDYED